MFVCVILCFFWCVFLLVCVLWCVLALSLFISCLGVSVVLGRLTSMFVVFAVWVVWLCWEFLVVVCFVA